MRIVLDVFKNKKWFRMSFLDIKVSIFPVYWEGTLFRLCGDNKSRFGYCTL